MNRKLLGVCGAIMLCSMMGVEASAATISCGLPEQTEEAWFSRPEDNRISLEEHAGDAQIIYDLPYCGENSTSYQKLHLVIPNTQSDEKMPVLIYVHGGAWSSDNSEEDHRVSFVDQAGLWALDYGYAVAFVDYSIRNQENLVALPDQIYEIKAAVRYMRSIADEYNLDADKIALMGESAGGQLVDIVGTTNGEKEYDIEELGNMDYSSDVQAVIGQYSVGDMSGSTSMFERLCGVDPETMDQDELLALTEKISAIDHVDENDPPFYLEHGLSDNTVPYTQSCDLYNALVNAGNDESELHLYPGMDHAVSWFQSEENSKGYMEWLDKIFER